MKQNTKLKPATTEKPSSQTSVRQNQQTSTKVTTPNSQSTENLFSDEVIQSVLAQRYSSIEEAAASVVDTVCSSLFRDLSVDKIQATKEFMTHTLLSNEAMVAKLGQSVEIQK